jgi:tetratricopeptide (TPR) repeat protein
MAAVRPVICRAFCTLAIVLATLFWSIGTAAQQRSIDDLLKAYEAGDYQVLNRYVTTTGTFEQLRKELGSEKEGQLDGAMQRWDAERRPAHAVFMLELALVGSSRGWPHWLDVLSAGTRFLVIRPDLPGEHPEWDAFEVAWHKAAVALLQGIGRPDLLRQHGMLPLASRMGAEPAVGRMVDPWIALARGVNQEQFAKVPGAAEPLYVAAALGFYEVAARYPSTKAEALVRKAGLVLDMGSAADAIKSLDLIDGTSIADPDVAYWFHMQHGRALEALERFDDAQRAFELAAGLSPGAPSPHIALAALALKRDDRARSVEFARRARRHAAGARDPWWAYLSADYRLFGPRLVALRRLVK